MKTMYTKTPDDGCYEVSNGIYARPVHNSAQPKLKKQGWTYHEEQLRKETSKEASQEAEEVKTDLDLARIAYEQRFGSKPHHKMMLETIQDKLSEADD